MPGVRVEMIKSLQVILEIITCGHRIDEETFQTCSDKTARLYVNLYSWHPMISTMHKVLIHDAPVIKKAIVPIYKRKDQKMLPMAETNTLHSTVQRPQESAIEKFATDTDGRQNNTNTCEAV